MSLRAKHGSLYVRSKAAADIENMSTFANPAAGWDFVGQSINGEQDKGQTPVNASAGCDVLSQQDMPICVSRPEHDFNGDGRVDVIDFTDFVSQ